MHRSLPRKRPRTGERMGNPLDGPRLPCPPRRNERGTDSVLACNPLASARVRKKHGSVVVVRHQFVRSAMARGSAERVRMRRSRAITITRTTTQVTVTTHGST